MNRRKGLGCTFFLIVFFVVLFIALPSHDKKKESSAFSLSSVKRSVSITARPSATHTATPTARPTAKPTAKSTVAAKRPVIKKPSVTYTPSPTARIGDHGDVVQSFQEQLSELGYTVGKIDGIYGSKTENAVKAFQADNDLEASGEIDERTCDVIASKYKQHHAIDRKNNTSHATAKPTITPSSTKAKKKVEYPDYRDSASKGTKYVLNTSSKKFHHPSCRSVKKIKPKNYKEYTGSREDVISMGYVPCKVCYP